MSGTSLNQANVDVEISLNNDSTFVAFDCVTSFDTGSPKVAFVDVTCFSSPDDEPEMTGGRLTRSAGSLAYNASNATVHQHMLANPRSKVAIKSVVTFDGGATYTRTQSYILGGVSEPIEFDGTYVHTVEVQPTGAVTRAFADPA